ncbi:MAG: hypothetical protein FJ102_06570 [Deltaproteobacteria bacterium]|nr:hypothetical protein [Deltaproteobacteria bacterium]
MPTPDPTPAFVQAELAPESLRLPSFPPVWPEGHAGPAVACEMGAIVIDGMVAGLRTQPDCPPELVVAAADAARGTEWPALVYDGVTLSLAGYTWTQVFAPPGTVPSEVLAYGWRPGALPPHRGDAPASTTELATTIPFRAVVTVGSDGVPRGVAVDTTPSSTSSVPMPERLDGVEVAIFLPAHGQSGDALVRVPMQVDDPARELLAWRWPAASESYRVVVQRDGSAFPEWPVSEAVPESAAGPVLPSPGYSSDIYQRLRQEIVVPSGGPLTLHRPEAVDGTSPQWVIRADREAPFARVAQAINALVPPGSDATLSFAVTAPFAGAIMLRTREVAVSRATLPAPGAGPSDVFFRPADDEPWDAVLSQLGRLQYLGFRGVLTPDTAPAPPLPLGRMGGSTPVETGSTSVHWSEVQLKRRVTPKWPVDPRRRHEVSCVIGLEIDEEGVPTSVTRRDCPDPFFAAAEEAAMQWRWYPIQPDPVAVHFDINFAFRLVDER